MIIKNIAKICKAHGTLRLWDDGPYQQWLGDIGPYKDEQLTVDPETGEVGG